MIKQFSWLRYDFPSSGCIIVVLIILVTAIFMSTLIQARLPITSANIIKTSATTCQDGAGSLSVALRYPRRLAPSGTNLFRLPLYLSLSKAAPDHSDYEIWLQSSDNSLLFTDAGGAPMAFPLLITAEQLASGTPQTIFAQRFESETLPKYNQLILNIFNAGQSAQISCDSWVPPPQIEYLSRESTAFSLWLAAITRPEMIPTASVLALLGIMFQIGFQRLLKHRDILREEKHACLSRIKSLKTIAKTNIIEAIIGWANEENRLTQFKQQKDEEALINRMLANTPEIRIALDTLGDEIRAEHWQEPLLHKIFDCYNHDNQQSANEWEKRYTMLDKDQKDQIALRLLTGELQKVAEWRNCPSSEVPKLQYEALFRQYEHFRFHCHRPLADLLAELIKKGQVEAIYQAFDKSEVGHHVLMDQAVYEAAEQVSGEASKPENKKAADQIKKRWLVVEWGSDEESYGTPQRELPPHSRCGTEVAELDPDLWRYREELPCFNNIVHYQHDIILGEPGSGKTTAARWLVQRARSSKPPQRVFAAFSSELSSDPKRWMVHIMAAALRDFIGRNPLAYLLAGPAAQLAIEALLWTEANDRENLLRSLSITGIEHRKDGQIAMRRILAGNGSLPESISTQRLAEVMGLARPAQFDASFLILDLPPNAQRPLLDQSLQQLLNYCPVLMCERVFLKLFMPGNLLNSERLNTVQPVCLTWQDENLMNLTGTWKNTPRDIFKSSPNDREGRSKQLVIAAKGSPRSLVRLANRLAQHPGRISDETFQRIINEG